jgi:hypothetical protein
MIKIATATALAVALSTSAMAAQSSLPSIDSAKYCAAISGLLSAASPGASLIRDGCLKNETDYAEKLIRAWPKIAEDDRSQCLRILAFSQPSNQGLAGCIILSLGKRTLDELASNP